MLSFYGTWCATELLGDPVREKLQTVDRARPGPVIYVTAVAPPFLLIHGTNDLLVPYETEHPPGEGSAGGGHQGLYGANRGCRPWLLRGSRGPAAAPGVRRLPHQALSGWTAVADGTPAVALVSGMSWEIRCACEISTTRVALI
ncbi:hypothetical protein [Streptomyces sp. NBC_01262]|uniref:hypothetical protein n=1 Tax=Streptomyces sp. NBC_01262 TaxID=2903803 RepID=UPI003FCE0C83